MTRNASPTRTHGSVSRAEPLIYAHEEDEACGGFSCDRPWPTSPSLSRLVRNEPVASLHELSHTSGE